MKTFDTKKYAKEIGLFKEAQMAIKTRGTFVNIPASISDLVDAALQGVDFDLAAQNLAADLTQKGITKLASLDAIGQRYGARIALLSENKGYNLLVTVRNVNGGLPEVQKKLEEFRQKYNAGAYGPKTAIAI